MSPYERQKSYRLKEAEKKKKWLDEIRSVACVDCGGFFPPVCMDFDHLPGSKKLFGIMNQYARVGWQKILDEIAKCEIVCANCHRIRTRDRR